MFANPMKTRWLAGLLLGLIALPVAALDNGAMISLGKGEQRVLNFPSALAKVATSDPDIAAVTVSGTRELLLTGKAEGSAVLSVWLKDAGDPLKAPIVVAPTQGEKMPFGTQVQTDIRILEVSRSQLNELGFYYARLFDGGQSAIGVAPPGSNYRGFSGPGEASAAISTDGFNLFSFGANSLAIINALESGGFAYTLAQPSLTSISGQNATFLSGGEFPIPVSNDGDSIEVEYKEFGVSLSLTPTVVDPGQIILKVAPEVSELDFSTGVTTAGVSVPGLRVRRAQTTVSMGPGETFIISGLVSRSTINNSDRIPGLGDLPLLGALFRSDRISREDKELIMVVTPHIVSPGKAGDAITALPASDYHNSSMGWLDMATQTRGGEHPIHHGLSW